MPYIKKHRREQLDIFAYDGPENAGELNYAFSEIARQYVADNGESYQTYNDIIGALEGAKLELYRRKVAPYEDTKIEENGDVF